MKNNFNDEMPITTNKDFKLSIMKDNLLGQCLFPNQPITFVAKDAIT